MEVIFISTLAAIVIAYLIYLHIINSRLKNETEELGDLLYRSIEDSERTIEDQRASERELSIVKAKLESVKESSFTPENAVPKNLHVEKVMELSNKLGATKSMLEEVTYKFEESRGKQISERVRLGAVGENFCAFHEQFPYDRKKVKALFQPIDLIYFGEDELVFIDVKTGNSQLSKKQRKIRDNIQSGNIRFEVHRIDENGYDIKDQA